MMAIMSNISRFLSCNCKTYYTTRNKKIIVINIQSLERIKILIDYYNKYPLLGIKSKNFKDWVKVYHMVLNKKHLTLQGKSDIINITLIWIVNVIIY